MIRKLIGTQGLLMRYVIVVMLLVLSACQNPPKQPSAFVDSTRTILQNDSSTVSQSPSFDQHDLSEVKYYSTGPYISITTNVTYSIAYLSRNHTLADYIVKEIRLRKTFREREGGESMMGVEIYEPSQSKPIRTISKRADKVDISIDFMKSTLYGCCDAEDYRELSDLWLDSTFLTFNTRYYSVDIPNARLSFFFGYLVDARDEGQLMHGELHFARARGTLGSGGKYYGNEYTAVSRVQFKANTKALFDRMIPFTPEITLLKNTAKDEIRDFPDHQELRLWSFNGHEHLEGIDFVAMRLAFQNDTTITIDIPIKNGFMFGDASPVRTVYIKE